MLGSWWFIQNYLYACNLQDWEIKQRAFKPSEEVKWEAWKPFTRPSTWKEANYCKRLNCLSEYSWFLSIFLKTRGLSKGSSRWRVFFLQFLFCPVVWCRYTGKAILPWLWLVTGLGMPKKMQSFSFAQTKTVLVPQTSGENWFETAHSWQGNYMREAIITAQSYLKARQRMVSETEKKLCLEEPKALVLV